MNRYWILSLLTVLSILVMTQATEARTTQTKITVRAISQGAKFIGSSMEGARITIRDAESGEILDTGITSGSTGNTDKIMREQHGRNRVFSSPGSAKYTSKLWLEKPRTLKIRAYGPMSNPDDANSASVTQKVLPGKDLTGGDAVRLQIRGFVVDILEPGENWFQVNKDEIHVKARVSMMCGCPITPDGLWDANDYQIRLAIYEGNELIDEYPLRYAGEPSMFERALTFNKKGCYRFVVYAYDPATGNTGYETYSCTVSD